MQDKKLKKLYIKREACLERFNRWEETHPREISFEQAISGLDLIYSLLPTASRNRKIDPTGVISMHNILAGLKL